MNVNNNNLYILATITEGQYVNDRQVNARFSGYTALVLQVRPSPLLNGFVNPGKFVSRAF